MRAASNQPTVEGEAEVEGSSAVVRDSRPSRGMPLRAASRLGGGRDSSFATRASVGRHGSRTMLDRDNTDLAFGDNPHKGEGILELEDALLMGAKTGLRGGGLSPCPPSVPKSPSGVILSPRDSHGGPLSPLSGRGSVLEVHSAYSDEEDEVEEKGWLAKTRSVINL